MMKQILYLVVLISLFWGCSGEDVPDGVLKKKEMATILVDIHLSEAINIQRFNLSMIRDSLPEDLYLSICKKNKIDRETIEKSLLYYGKNPRVYLPVYDEVLNRLNEMEMKAKSDTVRPIHQ